jgi:hypothetical protein
MWRRGADAEGYAANFVESEQIMQSKGFTASYVQVGFFTQFIINHSTLNIAFWFHTFRLCFILNCSVI